MALTEKVYNKIFLDSGLVGKDDLAKARAVAKETGQLLEGVLVGGGVLTEDQAGKLVADAYGVNFVNLGHLKVDAKAATLIPEIVVKKQGVFAYGWNGEALQVAMVEPDNVEFIGFLEKKSGYPIEVAYTLPTLMADALASFGEDIIGRLTTVIQDFQKATPGKKKTLKDEAVDDDLIIRFVDLMMQYGYANAASDIHIEPQDEKSLLRYRVDGVLHDLLTMPTTLYEKVVARVKILSNLRTDEHFAAQDGKFRFRVDKGQVDVRVSILPVVGGEKIVMRILSDKGRAFTLEHLGYAPADLAKVKNAALKPYGMILATGPTGSGKTTSMYAVLRLLNRREVNIQTIEDPVEYDIEGVNQIQVNERTNLTFAMGLRSIVRQDPDIIMVGEIRDSETAGIAINAAMTGHLVLSTLHTNDSATALPRLLDMGVEPFLVASSVNVIIAQRLVRKNCPACIQSVKADPSLYKTSLPKELFEKYFSGKEAPRLFKGKGCPSCSQTGYSGRVGIFEVLEVTDPIRELIVNRANAGQITKQAVKEGMTLMFEDGLRKAFEGVTTIEEVLRVAVS